MSYSDLTVGDIFTITKGKKHEIVESQSIHSKRVIGIDDLRNDNLIRFTDDPKGTEVFDDDVLIAWDGANAGTIGYGKHGFIGSTIARLRFKEKGKFSAAYIGMLLKSKFDYLRQTATGATIPHISRKVLERISVPNISLEDQSRTSYLLGKVESLIHERKQSFEQLDELLKSAFLDMFGDPVRNEKEWDKSLLGNLLKDIESGKSPKCESRPAEIDEWGVLKLSALTNCIFREGESKALPLNTTPHKNYEVRPKDVLFSRKNTYELVASCAYVYETRSKLLMPDLIFRLVIKDEKEIHPIFLWKLLTFPSQRSAIQALAAGAAGSMPNISKANLRKAEVITPPIDHQHEFISFVSKVEKIKLQYQSSLSDLEQLYNALSQKAFKGELDLSGIKLQGEEVELSSFDRLQQSIDAVNRLIPEPVRRITETVNKIIPPSIRSLGPFSHLDLFGFKDPKARQQILEHWFNEWLEGSQADELKLYRFWARAQISLVDYLYEEDLEEFEFSVEDYDVVKKLLFQAIDNGLIKQTVDTVELNDESEAGNRVILVKG